MDSTKGQIAPTQAKMAELKKCIMIASNAANMLMKKSQMYDMYLKDYCKKLEANTELMENVMREAYIKLAKANYTLGGMCSTNLVKEIVQNCASIKVTIYEDRFLGNAIFHTMYEENTPEIWHHAGLSKGGQDILEVKKIFKKAAEVLVVQVSLKSVFMALLNAKETTIRKSLVIEKIIVPRIQATVLYIRNYLDDMERDDKYRYKLVKKLLIVKAKEAKIKEEAMKMQVFNEPI